MKKLFAAVALLGLMALMQGCTSEKVYLPPEGLLIIAHRGGVVDDETSESSFSALEKAIQRGYTHVEVDLRPTADGHTVDYNKEKVERFHKLGIPVIVSINTFHYPRDRALEIGSRDVVKMLELGVDGLQIDSCYASVGFKGEIKVVIFDVGGVLTKDILGPKIRELAQKYDKDVALLSEARKKYRPLVDLGQINESEFWRRVLKDVGVEATAEDCDFSPYIEPIDGTLEITQALKDRYKLAILSNDSPETARARRDKFGFHELFGEIVISCEVDIKKPDPRIYELTIKRLGVKPTECLFIDNRERNLKPAREIGMRTILFKDAEQLRNDLREIGVALP